MRNLEGLDARCSWGTGGIVPLPAHRLSEATLPVCFYRSTQIPTVLG